MTTRVFAACSLLVLLTAPVTRAETHTITGRVIALTINDLSNIKGLDADERLYAVAVRLDSDPDRLMGLMPTANGQLSDIQKEMSHLLREAFLNGWQVTIRWESSLSTRAPILSVTVTRK